MAAVEILLEDSIVSDWQRGELYAVTFGGNTIWEKPVDYYRDTDDDKLTAGRREFAERFRELLTSQD